MLLVFLALAYGLAHLQEARNTEKQYRTVVARRLDILCGSLPGRGFSVD